MFPRKRSKTILDFVLKSYLDDSDRKSIESCFWSLTECEKETLYLLFEDDLLFGCSEYSLLDLSWNDVIVALGKFVQDTRCIGDVGKHELAKVLFANQNIDYSFHMICRSNEFRPYEAEVYGSDHHRYDVTGGCYWGKSTLEMLEKTLNTLAADTDIHGLLIKLVCDLDSFFWDDYFAKKSKGATKINKWLKKFPRHPFNRFIRNNAIGTRAIHLVCVLATVTYAWSKTHTTINVVKSKNDTMTLEEILSHLNVSRQENTILNYFSEQLH